MLHRSSQAACCAVWLLGGALAAVPLLPVTSHWSFYSQTAICIPLPITTTYFPGQGYSFAVIVVLNFALFVLIAAGQMSIYLAIRGSAMTADSSTKRSNDLTVARRLLSVVLSDLLCWFPIGLLGLLATSGDVVVPPWVNVALAVVCLPLNSALNPFLYTANVLLEKRRLAKEERLRKALLAHLTEEAAVET